MFCGFGYSSYAQSPKKTTSLSQVWAGYFNQTRVSKRIGFWMDVQARTKDNLVDSLVTFVIRPGITYYITDNTRITAGYAFMNHFPADNAGNISQPEHRFWQQFQWTNNYPKARLTQRFRLEERFRRNFISPDELADDYFFNYRMRYNMAFQFPLTGQAYKKGSLSAFMSDEIMINFGKQIVYNYFDQNRFLIGLNYYLNDNNTIFLGYMNQFQQLVTGNDYLSMHVMRIVYTQNLDFSKTR